jgi:hypothetical protein
VIADEAFDAATCIQLRKTCVTLVKKYFGNAVSSAKNLSQQLALLPQGRVERKKKNRARRWICSDGY